MSAKKQDWVCSCGQKNFSHNDTECSNCKKGKSSQRNKLKIDKYARADDWKCKNCGYVSNFASNTYCYKCKKLKETRNAGYHNEYVGSSLGYEISNFRDVNHTKSYLKTEKTAESGKKLQKSEYFTKCEPISLHVNYYPINLDKLVNAVYMYEILYKPNQNGVVTKVTSIIAVKTFMTNWFKGIDYAYDGCKIIYTNKKLNLDSMYLYDINIEIRFIKEVDMSKLKTLGEEEDFSKQIQALNIIVCKVFTEMILFDNVAKCGSHIYTPKYSVILHDRFDKLMPYELWYGFIQSVIVKKKATYLNVDVTEKVFTRGVNLLEFFHYYNSNKKVIIKHLNKLVIVYQGNAYHFKKFVSSDDEIYINDYGYITYNEIGNDPLIHLDLYQLPVPVSQCYILSGQLISKMTSEIKFAWNRHFLTDEDRKKKIQELFGRISYNEVLSNFGIMIRNEFEKVEGFIIAPPKLRFAYGEVVDPVNGKWMSKFLLKPAEGFIKWAVIKCVATIDENHLQHFYQLLDLQSKMQNISFEESPTLEFKARESDKFFEALRQQLQLCKEIKCHIVFIILNKNDERYNEIKVIADTEVGILTQCVVAAKVVKVNTVIINGLIHKVNAKLNGINREIVDEIFEEHKRTMFIGADVSHGGPAKIPSIVGVTSSFDTRGFKFYPTWRMQCKENGSGRGMQLEEMILDLENVAKDHLRNYLKYNNEAPDKIIYYRDGVSDSQFKQVVELEMTALKNAIDKVTPKGSQKPTITFVVGQKRHKTRLFPTNQKWKNVPIGTIVNRDITHHSKPQFLLTSRTPINCVSQTTKYCILKDESIIDEEELTKITFDICHVFAPSDHSVPYATPTYYADLLASRARRYVKKKQEAFKGLTNSELKRQSELIMPVDFKNEFPMFFI